MNIRTNLGVSLDGFIATREGLPASDTAPGWSPAGNSHAYDEFNAQPDIVAMGRTCFDQGFEYWLVDWPWPGKPVYVLTSRPLPEAASDMNVTAAGGGPAGLIEQMIADGLDGNVQLLGGSQTVQSFLGAGLIDEFGICILPVMLGSGIPVFDIEPVAFSADAWTASLETPPEHSTKTLRLDRHRVFPDGAVTVVYSAE